MKAHYYNPENPGIWTRAIPEFETRKTADCNANPELDMDWIHPWIGLD